MPAQIPCPISEVDRALATYIHTREEALKIRRTLSKYLTNGLRPVTIATQSQHINHECPQNISAVPTNPPGLKDLRLQYYQALRARNEAQSRHGALQDSLADLQQQHIDENPTQPQSDYENEATRSYIALLQQRRRLAELEVIQNALEKLLIAKPSNIGKDPKTMIDEVVGNQPDLPAERLDQLSSADNDQNAAFKIKQEVLDSRSRMDQAKAATAKTQAAASKQPKLEQQVFALECARDEIVEWVQGELSKLEEDSMFLEDASPIKRAIPSNNAVDLESAETRIRDAYNRYVSSRAAFTKSYEEPRAESLPQDRKDGTSGPPVDLRDTNTSQKSLSFPISKILPHLPHLTQTATNERSLLRQSVYLENQIAAADQDIEEALLRLSGESHLLPAGSKHVAAWGKTAAEAETTNRQFVKEHLDASQQELGSVGTIVDLCSLQSKVLASS